MEPLPELSYCIGKARIDRAMQGIVGLINMALPGRMRACYLTGSHTDGTATQGSDIDIEIVLADSASDHERHIIERIGECSGLIGPVQVDLTPVDEHELQTLTGEGYSSAVSLKSGAELIYGVDLRNSISMPPVARFGRESLYTGASKFLHARRDRDVLVYPLTLPDPSGEFYGYDRRLMSAPDGSQRYGLKDLVVSACWCAAGILALETGIYSTRKGETVRLYSQHIKDHRAELLRTIDQVVRREWGYFPPERPDQRALLREICDKMLDFENGILHLIRDLIVRDLYGGSESDKLMALETLGFIQYPDDHSLVDAVRVAAHSEDTEVRQSARRVLAEIAKI